MKKLTHLPMAIAIGVFLFSCGGGSSSSEGSTEAVSETEETTPKYSQKTAVGVFHDVEDVANWTAGYEALSDPEARINVLTNSENPMRLAVFLWTENHRSAKEYFESDQFRSDADSIGVVGEIGVVYYDVKELSDQPALPYVITVGHEVSEFDAWKIAYDADADSRKNAGLKFEALATGADNPNMVYLMFSTSDLEASMAMMGSEELRLKMAEAGVLGAPQVSTWLIPTTE
ncbi:MAG: hypothetical protein ABJG78_04820 [Cyclobacteriaceae bacterium]